MCDQSIRIYRNRLGKVVLRVWNFIICFLLQEFAILSTASGGERGSLSSRGTMPRAASAPTAGVIRMPRCSASL